MKIPPRIALPHKKYSNKELSETRTGGTPYGPTHFSGDGKNKLSDSEAKLCFSFGERIAKLTLKL